MEFITEKLLNKYPINLEIAKDQDEYITLPVHLFTNKYGTVLCGLKLSDEEIEKIKKEKCLYVCFQTLYKPLTPFRVLIGEDETNNFINAVGE